MFGIFKKFNQSANWQRWQRGQAMAEYWPTFPVAVMIAISASALVGPVSQAFQVSANHLNSVCDYSITPTETDLDGGHHIAVVASAYDEDNDRTTVTFKVSSGDSPSISHWVLGIDELTADQIVASSEAYESWGVDPTTGKSGIKFDTGYEGGDGGGRGPRRAPALAPTYNTYVEEREITLTLTGYVDFVDQIEVTTKAGSSQVSSGYIGIPVSGGSSTGC